MANEPITASIIAKAMLACVENEMVASRLCNRAYQEEFHKKVNGYEVGDTIDVERPNLFYSQKGQVNTDVQSIKPGKAQIKVDQQASVRWGFNSAEMTMTIQAYAEKHLKSAGAALAQTLDTDLFRMADDIYNHVGVPGTVPSTFAEASKFNKRMDEMAVPKRERSLILSTDSSYAIANDQTKLFNNNINSPAYRKAQIGEVSDLMTYRTQNTPIHRTGQWTGATPLVKGANQHVDWSVVKNADYGTIEIDGWAVGNTLKKGDVFTIAGVYALNPVPGEKIAGVVQKKQQSYLQQFTVKEDVAVNAGVMVVKIRPFIIIEGAQRTVSASPADNAAVTMVGLPDKSYEQDIAIHKDAFSLAVVPLVLPHGSAWKSRASSNGLSLRVTKEYDQATDIETIRADMLYGYKCLRPEFAVKGFGALIP